MERLLGVFAGPNSNLPPTRCNVWRTVSVPASRSKSSRRKPNASPLRNPIASATEKKAARRWPFAAARPRRVRSSRRTRISTRSSLSGARLAQKYVCEAVPAIAPAAVEVPFAGAIAGVAVRGIADIMTTDGTIIDVKTASRKPSGVAADHALQLATYAELLPGASGMTRIDTLVSTRDPQLIQLEHTPGERGKRLIERLYPMVAEGIAGGLFLPNRNSTTCSRRYCAFADACEREYGGVVE